MPELSLLDSPRLEKLCVPLSVDRELEAAAQLLIEVGAQRLLLVAGIGGDAAVVLDQAGDVVLGVLGAAAHAGVGLVRERLVAVELLLEIERPAGLKERGDRVGVAEDAQRLVQRWRRFGSRARWPAKARPTAA